jgi:hypothetical protein
MLRFSISRATPALNHAVPNYSPSPECPVRKSGDEWQGDPPKLQQRGGKGYGEFRIRTGMPRAGSFTIYYLV